MADVFYRFVKSEIMTIDDFKSQGALGKVMARPGNQEAWDNGVSVWGTFESAELRARELRFSPGSYVVELVLPDNHGLRIDGPSGKSGQHYTILYADPQFLMDCAGIPVKMTGAS